MTARLVHIVTACLLFASGCGSPADYQVIEQSRLPDTAGVSATATRSARQRRDSDRRAPALPEKPELSDLLAYAALRNAGLEAAFNRWRAALERVPQAKALPEPRFTYRYFIREVETRVGAQRNSFELAQRFPWFGKLAARGDLAAEAANAERQRYAAARLKLFYQVKQAYYEYYYLGKAIAITDENLRLVKHVEALARTRYKTDAGSHPDVIRAQVELGKLSDALASLKDLREPIVARLNAALNRPPSALVGPYPTSIETEKVKFTSEELLSGLIQANPELKRLDSEIARRKRAVELARKDYFPDFTFGLAWIDTARSIAGRRPDDDGNDPLIAMVSVNLPIWRDKLAAAVREARHSHTMAVHRRTQKANSLAAELNMALFGFRDAERKIELYRDTLLPKARQAFEATQAAYRPGKASFSDLVDAERELLKSELDHQRALADRAQRLAELEMLVGRKLPAQAE